MIITNAMSCPFCGCKEIHSSTLITDKAQCLIHCNDCGAGFDVIYTLDNPIFDGVDIQDKENLPWQYKEVMFQHVLGKWNTRSIVKNISN